MPKALRYTASASAGTLVFDFEYPDATGFDQSEVLVIHRVISHTKYAWYTHLYTANPTKLKRTFTVYGTVPGAYVIKYLLVKGTRQVDQYMKFVRITA